VSVHYGGKGPGHLSRYTAAGGVGYSAEATAYFAAMSVAPDDTRKGLLNTLIAALMTAGVWTKLDALYIMAAHDAQAARVNAANPASVATVSGSEVFLADRGYKGDASASYIDTGWNPTTASSPKWVRNDAHMGIWCNQANTTAAADMGQTLHASIAANYFGQFRYYTQAGSASGPSNSPGAASHFMWSRTASANTDAYRAGVYVASVAHVSQALVNANFLINASNSSTTGTITPANYSANRLAVVHWGSKLTSGEVTALYNALNTYLTAVGGA